MLKEFLFVFFVMAVGLCLPGCVRCDANFCNSNSLGLN